MTETMKWHGQLQVQVIQDGKVIDTWTEHNLILDGARDAAARLFAGEGVTGHSIAQIVLGTNGTKPREDDNAITDAFTKAVASFSFPAAGQVAVSWEIGTDEANGKAIREFGLVAADGTLLARAVREDGTALNKSADLSLHGTWTWMF